VGLIPDDTIDEIRRRIDIVEVIGAHVQLKKAGHNHKGLCPFHNEKTPSFNVNAAKGFFYCFGCQKKGDAFSFVMEYEGKSFLEAARTLAERTGVTIPEHPITAGERSQRSQRSTLLEVNRIAARFFRDTLLDDRRGATGRAYLLERGIDAATAEHFELGYAADAWDALASHLTSRQVPGRLAELAGLVVPRKQRDGYYDRFRNRLVCPVILPGGEIAGFSGRLLGDTDAAKYINTPETPVFKKSRLLFGIHRARDAFRTKRRAIVVEGNFDVISLHQHGYEEAVASLGTALTAEQVEALRRLCDEVVLVYDGDRAGRAAALKALGVLEKAGVASRIAVPPGGLDPDELVRRDPAGFEQLLRRAQPGPEYFIYEVWSRGESSAASRAQAIAEASELIGSVPDPVKRDMLVDTLARAMSTDPGVVRRALARPRAGGQPTAITGTSQRRPRGPEPPTRELELEIVAILADHPKLLTLADELDVFSLLTNAHLRDMYSAARQGQSLLSALPDDDANQDIAAHVFSGAHASLHDPAETLRTAVRQLEKVRNRARLDDLQKRAVEARRRGDDDEVRRLSLEIVTMRRQVD
jgi:DNA primase